MVRLELLLVLVRPAQREAKTGDLGVLGLDLYSNVFTARDAVFGAAALSLNRQTSSCLVSEFASDRASRSDRRSSSRRNSATLARLRSSLTRASASSSRAPPIE